MKTKMTCSTPMETQFFTCNVTGRNLDICASCGMSGVELVEPAQEVKVLYSKVFAICTDCKKLGREFVHGRKAVGQKAKHASKKREAERTAYRAEKKSREAGAQQQQQQEEIEEEITIGSDDDAVSEPSDNSLDEYEEARSEEISEEESELYE